LDGELPDVRFPIVPGHEIVGIVELLGAGVSALAIGQRVGVARLGNVCAQCEYRRCDRENLCDAATFTGYSRDGGFATRRCGTYAKHAFRARRF